MNIIYKTKFGSHLYGTSTPTSDLDYKGVYIAKFDDIILNRVKDSVFENIVDKQENGRNTKDAIDCEYIELRKFIKDCLAGQTYALDILFSNLGEIKTDIWDDLVANRMKLLSKDVKPYIGYCHHQAAKYGLKGSRLGELIKVINILTKLPPNDRIIEHMSEIPLSEYVTIKKVVYSNTGRDVEQEFLSVLERKFEIKTRIKDVLAPLQKMNDNYGARAVDAMNNSGIDWKAISHAFRCMFQLEELALTGEIKFPLAQADFLKDIKTGKVTWEECNGQLYSLIQESIKKVGESTILPDKPDYEFWDKWLVNQYNKNL